MSPSPPELRVVVDADDPDAIRAARDAVGWREWWSLEGVDPEMDLQPGGVVVRVGRHVRLRPHAVVRIREALRASRRARRFLVWDPVLRRALPAIEAWPLEKDPGTPPGASPWRPGDAALPVHEGAVEVLGDRVPPELPAAFELGAMEGRAAASDPERADERAPYLHLLLEWYVVERDPRLLWTWLGVVAGATSHAETDRARADRLAALLGRGREDWARLEAVRPYLEAWDLDALREQLVRAKGPRSWRLLWDPAYQPPRPLGGFAGWLVRLARRVLRPILTSRD